MIMFSYTVYTTDKFHIQWCLYPMMDLWNTINEWMNANWKYVAVGFDMADVVCVVRGYWDVNVELLIGNM